MVECDLRERGAEYGRRVNLELGKRKREIPIFFGMCRLGSESLASCRHRCSLRVGFHRGKKKRVDEKPRRDETSKGVKAKEGKEGKEKTFVR